MALDTQHPSSLPFIIGQVNFFAMNSAPSGFLKCAGQAVLRSTYAKLFAAIGTTYGAGDGSTTFNLPDLRGEFVRCFDGGRAVDSGRVLGSAQGQSIQAHTHTIANAFNAGRAEPYNGGDGNDFNMNSGGSTGSTGDSETRPRNVALLACIFTGVQ
jgi:microcystin-dependent protein